MEDVEDRNYFADLAGVKIDDICESANKISISHIWKNYKAQEKKLIENIK